MRSTSIPRAPLISVSNRFFVLPALFSVELVLGGPYGVYHGVPLRFILFFGAALSLAAAVHIRGAVSAQSLGALWSIAAFIVVELVWTTIIPSLSAGVLAYGIAEGRAIFVLVLPLMAVYCIPTASLEGRVRSLQRFVVRSSALLAIAQVVIWIVGTLVPSTRLPFVVVVDALLSPTGQSLYIGGMKDGFFRVFWISSLWHLVAFFWIPLVVTRRSFALMLRLLALLAVLVSYSRGIWLGLAAGYLVSIIVRVGERRFVGNIAKATLAITMAVGFLSIFATVMGQDARLSGRVLATKSGHDIGINERFEQSSYLFALFREHPLIGGGYGAYSKDYIRTTVAPFSYENMPVAMLAKLGLVGLSMSLIFPLYWAISTLARRRWWPRDCAALLGSATALIIASMTNPMLINFVGMGIVSVLLLQWSLIVSANPPVRGDRIGDQEHFEK
jgi:hypothetical protein